MNPKVCYNCHVENAFDAKYCSICSAILDEKFAIEKQEAEKIAKEQEKQTWKSEAISDFKKMLDNAIVANDQKKIEFVREPLTDEQNDVLNKPENQFPHEIVSDGILHDIEVSPEDIPEKEIDVVNRVLKTDKKE